MMDACNLPSCFSCNRVDQEEIGETTRSLVTYHNEFAVITTQAPELDSEPAYMSWMLGFCELKNQYMTLVVHLGDEKASLKQSSQLVDDDDFYRYWVRHNNFDNLLEAHQMVVSSLKNGLIDVSQGRGVEFFEERDANLYEMKSQVAQSTNQPWDGKL
jgi:hypothetical protein